MPLEFQSVTFTSPDPESDARFWAAVLDRSPAVDGDAILLAGEPGQVGIRFASGPPHRGRKNGLHLHLTEGVRAQSDTIAACVQLGGRLLGNGHVPENSYAVMADVVGDEFCVIEDGNTYLAGCGPLGEVTCAGSPAVGHFWAEALGWPLVWEVGAETVIQSPLGGTKLAWSGDWPEETPRDRQYFVVTTASERFDDEVRRLVGLGASVGRADGVRAVTLSDPDGTDFVLRAAS
jgi:glyoxalase superfamily protein